MSDIKSNFIQDTSKRSEEQQSELGTSAPASPTQKYQKKDENSILDPNGTKLAPPDRKQHPPPNDVVTASATSSRKKSNTKDVKWEELKTIDELTSVLSSFKKVEGREKALFQCLGQLAILNRQSTHDDYVIKMVLDVWLDINSENTQAAKKVFDSAWNRTKPFYTAETPNTAIRQKLSEVEPKKIEFLWNDTIPRRMLTIVAGRSGVGKSTALAKIVADISQDKKVLLYSAEDDYSHILQPRLKASGAKLENIDLFPIPTGLIERQKIEDVILKAQVEAGFHYDVFVFDPLIHCVKGSTNEASNVRRHIENILGPIRASNAACIGVHHLRKDSRSNEDPQDAIKGSASWVEIARTTFRAEQIEKKHAPEKVTARDMNNNVDKYGALICVNTNISAGGFAFHYEILISESGVTHAQISSRFNCSTREAIAEYQYQEKKEQTNREKLAGLEIEERTTARSEVEMIIKNHLPNPGVRMESGKLMNIILENTDLAEGTIRNNWRFITEPIREGATDYRQRKQHIDVPALLKDKNRR